MSRRIIKVFKNREIWFAAAVFLLAFSLRGAYLYQSRDNPTFRAPVMDSLAYDQLARGLIEGKPLTHEFFWQQFFYPFFLSLIYFFSHSSIVCAKLVQMLIGCVTCVLTYRLGERIFGRAAGVLAGCMIAAYGPLIFFEGELLADGLATFWAAALILLFLKAVERESLGLYFVLGLCSALSIITRPNFVPFLAAAGVWLVVVWIRRRVGIKKIALGLVNVAIGFWVAAGPFAFINYKVTKNFSFLPADGAINIYMGNNPDFEAVSIRPGLEWKNFVDLPLEEGLRTPGEQKHFFYSKTFEYIRTQPMSFLKGLLRKCVEFFSSREMPGNIDVYLFARWSRLLGLLTWKVGGFGFPFGLLLPLALLGVIFRWRMVPIPVILFSVFYSASVVLTHIQARFRMPIIVPMCVLGGAALVRVIEMVSMRRWGSIAIVCLFGAAVGFLSSVAGPFYAERPDKINYKAELYYGLGDSLEQHGRAGDAMEAYYKALSLKSDYVEVHNNLGLLLVDQGRVQEAIAHYNTALSIDPKNAYLHNNLGKALQSQGKLDEAISQYRQALQVKPYDAEAHVNLGVVFQSQGRFDEAISHYRQALQINPDLLIPLNGMVWILVTHPDPKKRDANEAIKLAEHAAELTKYKDAFMLDTLAVAYSAAGQFDRAITTAQAALALASAAKNDQLVSLINRHIEGYKQAKH
jgi:Flp pilus assembly protein TadD/4-amino-4-deoxy-L-arabinose transferase-like glycosyltransferase